MACKYTTATLVDVNVYSSRSMPCSRWIRLLFGREFNIDNVLELWDAIFAEDPSLNIVEYVCLVLLIRIRDKCRDISKFWLVVGL
jgi:hypothetical protein